jgi:Ca2+-binding EF-hand superfamily protein
MTRLVGIFVVVGVVVFVLGNAEGQDKKQPKLDVDAIFKKLDTNTDGKLQKDEFVKMAEKYKDQAKAREKLTMVFAKIDDKGVGYLSKEQFRMFLESVNDKKKDQR